MTIVSADRTVGGDVGLHPAQHLGGDRQGHRILYAASYRDFLDGQRPPQTMAFGEVPMGMRVSTATATLGRYRQGRLPGIFFKMILRGAYQDENGR
jgi:hypothetical protein